jgi:hypothetical protein
MAKPKTIVHKYGLFFGPSKGNDMNAWILVLFSDRNDLDKHLETAINSDADSFVVLEHHPLTTPVSKEVAYNVIQVGRLDPGTGMVRT